MENKYYTPKIEEFYIGFRFEFYRTLTTYIEGQEPIVSSDWLEAVVATDFPNITIPMIDAMLEKGHIRVKELDEADIIEAGWNQNENQSPSYCTDYLLGDEWSLDIFDNERGIRIMNFTEIRFFGIIKNYNELLKVMEMLGIKKEE